MEKKCFNVKKYMSNLFKHFQAVVFLEHVGWFVDGSSSSVVGLIEVIEQIESDSSC